MKILKFGGTSVGKPERMKSIAQIINDEDNKVVVLSALSGTTNALVKICGAASVKNTTQASEEIEKLKQHHLNFIQELYADNSSIEKAQDYIQKQFTLISALSHSDKFADKEEKIVLAQGELLSTFIFHTYLEEIGLSSALISALGFMKINANGEPILKYIEDNILETLGRNPGKKIYITQGYICRNPANEIDNLQRGGSDYTASLIGAALRAEEIQIWTDIDGMHNNDPRVVDETFSIAELSFDEAAELAYFGAKILHPASIHPAKQYNIPVKLLNTMQPDAKGTTICNSSANHGTIKSIAAKDGIVAIKIKSSRMLMAYGFLRKVFEVFEKYTTPIDMITTSEVAVSLTIDQVEHLDEILLELQDFGTVEVDKDMSIVCVVGDFVSERQDMAYQVFESLKNISIRMISFGGSRHNISLLIPTPLKNETLNLLNEGLFQKV